MNYQECLGYQIIAGATPAQAQAQCIQYNGNQAGSGIDTTTMLMIGGVGLVLFMMMK